MKPCDSLHLLVVHGIAAELQIPGKITSIKVLFYVMSSAPKRSAFVSCVFAHSLNKIVKKKKHQLPTICFLFGKTHFSYRNLTSGFYDIFSGSFYVGSFLVGNAGSYLLLLWAWLGAEWASSKPSTQECTLDLFVELDLGLGHSWSNKRKNKFYLEPPLFNESELWGMSI